MGTVPEPLICARPAPGICLPLTRHHSVQRPRAHLAGFPPGCCYHELPKGKACIPCIPSCSPGLPTAHAEPDRGRSPSNSGMSPLETGPFRILRQLHHCRRSRSPPWSFPDAPPQPILQGSAASPLRSSACSSSPAIEGRDSPAHLGLSVSGQHCLKQGSFWSQGWAGLPHSLPPCLQSTLTLTWGLISRGHGRMSISGATWWSG